MGFRSTFVSDHYSVEIPEWFKEKYKEWLNCEQMPLSSKWETKTYGTFGEVCEDFQKVLQECKDEDMPTHWDKYFVRFVWLHECGGVTVVKVNRNEIIYLEPTNWEKTEGVTHRYCYDCSEPKGTL